MLHTWGQISEIVLPHGVSLVRMVKNPFAFQDEINLFLTVVEYGLAISAGINDKLPEPRDRSQAPILWVTLAKDGLVATCPRPSFCCAQRIQRRNVSV